MNVRMIIILVGIFFISLFIYTIKNFNFIKDFFIIILIFIILIICAIFLFCIKNVYEILDSIEFYKISKDNEKLFEEFNSKLEEEECLYRKIKYETVLEGSYESPYIPEGFTYVEGEWNTGYVIQDIDLNQYVWVPCEKIEKKNFYGSISVSKDEAYNENIEEFLTSVFRYGGFYISRFEIGKENDKPVSKINVPVYSNINQAEAKEIAMNMYSSINGNINCELVNGYAYDATLSWLKATNNIEIGKVEVKVEDNNFEDYQNVKGKNKDKKEKSNQEKNSQNEDNQDKNSANEENEYLEIITGRTMYNNIYDFTDNIMELSTETHFNTVIVRGFAYKEINEKDSRYAIFPSDNYFDELSLLTFRTVIYNK